MFFLARDGDRYVQHFHNLSQRNNKKATHASLNRFVKGAWDGISYIQNYAGTFKELSTCSNVAPPRHPT